MSRVFAAQHLVNAANIRADDRTPAGHGLEHHIGQAFVEAAETDDICGAHVIGHLRRRKPAGPMQSIADSKFIG